MAEWLIDLDREGLVFMARMTESAERYDDMTLVMERLVKMVLDQGKELTVDERNLLSVAFKNVVGARRASLRTLVNSNAIEDCYKATLQAELENICDQVLQLLKGLNENVSEENESKVFYLKMSADYYRYLAECVPENDQYNTKAKKNYEEAFTIAKRTLPPTHPIRLGLALNFSVCLYEICHSQTEACSLAKDAFDEAISELDKLEEADYKDSTLIMQLLRDNLTLWSTDNDEQ